MSFAPDFSKFRNSSGVYVVKAMFFEYDDTERKLAQYTLKSQDHTYEGKTYPSLKKLYLSLEDPTEYEFSQIYLDGWDHWKKLTKAGFFQEHLKEWREELEVRLRSKALHRIKVRAADNGKDSMVADKILLSGGWKTPDEKERVGRPSKQKIKEEADKLFEEQSILDGDFNRIMGNA